MPPDADRREDPAGLRYRTYGMMKIVSAQTAKELIHASPEIAVLDVREYGQFGDGHLLFASSCPYSVLEKRILDLVPNTATPCLLYDAGDGVGRKAARRIAELGYTNILTVDGGAPGWQEAGFPLFAGVNVPSKAFGEMVEAARHTPHIDSEELALWSKEGKAFLLVDTRPPTEHARMTLPGAVSLPNGELIHRLHALGLPPETPIILHCAGRTRGLIGTQTLIDAGVENPVFAFENGTQGWALSGRELLRGQSPAPMPELSPGSLADSARRAENFIARYSIPVIDGAQMEEWRADPSRSTYLLDVRSRREYDEGHRAGSIHAPVVQIVQATDEWVAVRRARLALIDDSGMRAATAAYWLRQLGFDAAVVRGALEGGLISKEDAAFRPADLPTITAEEIVRQEGQGITIVDLRTSAAYRTAHPTGALWGIRPRLDRLPLPKTGIAALLADDPGLASLAAQDLSEHIPGLNLRLLDGGLEAWIQAGGKVEASADMPSSADAIDFLAFLHDRHNGNLESARRYLAWETGLIQQLDARDLAEFHLAAGIENHA